MLKIFNTLTRKKEIFSPIFKGKINLYVCGVTVYDYCHIGHGRTFTFFDMMVRYLRHCKYKLNYVRNITDIDDKIIKKSKENNESIDSLTNRMILSMQKDFLNLGLIPPNIEPRATKYIDIIIEMIVILLKENYAYIASNGDVLFSVLKYKNYGFFSNQLLENLKKNCNLNLNNFKNYDKDFVLWKKIDKLNGITWISPWGYGRPGWHIECSAINYKYFGKYLDIHGGGIDLLFPHHENELAQSNCFHNNHYGNYWIHVGMLLIKNQKMSKRLNNTIFLKNILNIYNAEVIRYFFLSTHYRSPIYYHEEYLKKSYSSLKKLYFILNKYNDIEYNDLNKYDTFLYKYDFEKRFYQAINDDFNTPQAISILFEMYKKINYLLKNNDINLSKILIFKLKYLANIIGLLSQNPSDFLNYNNLYEKFDIDQNIKIFNLLKEREIARKNKLWNKSDLLRKKLLKLNIVLEDTVLGTKWKINKK